MDSGYLLADTLDGTLSKGYQIVTTERYNWITSQQPKIDPNKWVEYDFNVNTHGTL